MFYRLFCAHVKYGQINYFQQLIEQVFLICRSQRVLIEDSNIFKLLRSSRDINLDLSIEEIHVETSAHSNAVGGGVEDVAHDFTIAKGMIGNELAH